MSHSKTPISLSLGFLAHYNAAVAASAIIFGDGGRLAWEKTSQRTFDSDHAQLRTISKARNEAARADFARALPTAPVSRPLRTSKLIPSELWTSEGHSSRYTTTFTDPRLASVSFGRRSEGPASLFVDSSHELDPAPRPPFLSYSECQARLERLGLTGDQTQILDNLASSMEDARIAVDFPASVVGNKRKMAEYVKNQMHIMLDREEKDLKSKRMDCEFKEFKHATEQALKRVWESEILIVEKINPGARTIRVFFERCARGETQKLKSLSMTWITDDKLSTSTQKQPESSLIARNTTSSQMAAGVSRPYVFSSGLLGRPDEIPDDLQASKARPFRYRLPRLSSSSCPGGMGP
jgi:hypothetical protein